MPYFGFYPIKSLASDRRGGSVTTTIVDYGVCNVGAIANMLKKIGAECRVARTPRDLLSASRLILPGVGHFAAGMRALEERGYRPVLDRLVRDEGRPVLGICLGMQLLTRHSEEGDADGLGWIDARTVRFDPKRVGADLPIPHMGWNYVTAARDTRHNKGLDAESRFYFVHSYFVECSDEQFVLLWSEYGHRFTAAIQQKNVFGVQFHPEKSHRFGMTLLRNFVESNSIA